ncbi:uncharacterized protein [Arachis hypogaea]|uniref:uncharacterized protein n=1 Tax=Arachis hypogaea TaxID=3818 RepID=UPI003B212349
MIVNGASDTILCHCFPNYLDGPALDWLCALSVGSISRFQQLAKLFEDHFVGSAIYLHDSDYLNTIKQGPNESLKDYMTRFTKVTISIPDLHPEVHLHAIKSGLRPGKFHETIAISKPKTLVEFREKAKGQIDIEELRQAQKIDKTNYGDKEKVHNSKKIFKLTPHFDSYTQFNAKREDIIKEILNSKLIKPPRKAGTYQDTKHVDKSKYCAFHQKHGHTNDECIVAKDLLEQLGRQRHLDKYIRGHIQKCYPSSAANNPSEQPSRGKEKPFLTQYDQQRGIINCISGGGASGGSSNSARKRSFRTIYSVEGAQQDHQLTQQFPQMTFTQADFKSNIQNLDDPVVITIQLGDLLVKKVLLDLGSSADVLFYSTFQKMKLSDNNLQPTVGDLVGFLGERVPILVSVWLRTTLGEYPLSKTYDIQYLVVDCFSPYNLIFGRPFLNKFGAIVSTVHLCVKFSVQDEHIVTIHGDHKEARHCYNIGMKFQNRQKQPQINNVLGTASSSKLADLDPRADFLERPTLTGELQKIHFNKDPNKYTFVGTAISKDELAAIENFLQENADLFAWTPSNMPGIDPQIISHKMAINPTVRPVQQKKRNLGEEKKRASLEETQKRINADFIREIRYTTWLANVVMRLMDKIFAKQIGRNIEVYIDDMVAKTKVGHSHIDDLTEIFGQIRTYNMRLNPEKCAFAVEGGKFLDFLLTSRGIEANPDKYRAVLEMASPKTLKEEKADQLVPAADPVKFANKYCELRYPVFATSKNLYLERTLKILEELKQYTSDQIKQRGWFFLERNLTEINSFWVREFYCNYFKTSLDAVQLRGKQILVTKEAIEDILQLPPKSDQPDGYQRAEEDMRFMRFDWDAVKRAIALDPTVPWVMGKSTVVPKGIRLIYLNDEAQLWQQILNNYVMPSTHETELGRRAEVPWEIADEKPFAVDYRKIIPHNRKF